MQLGSNKDLRTRSYAGADPGFDKGWGAGGLGASFGEYLCQFRRSFKKIGLKTGGRAPPAPPSGSAPDMLVLPPQSLALCTEFQFILCA